ncbi:DUF6301 family protein [Streptomyces sp. NPDC006367]|uniref:DUF6301 family protein n=1 Tax=unclassified Streptomyces TaxID=2593676 RepID=UPI0033AE2F08
MSDTEVVALATRLQSLDCTWELGATPSARRSSRFPRKALLIRPRWDVLGTGFERDRHETFTVGEEELVERVRLRLTDYAEQWDQSLDAFARMFSALRGAFGDPTYRKPGRWAGIHWIGDDTTLLLERTESSVYLERATNKRLALDEELERLEETDGEELL